MSDFETWDEIKQGAYPSMALIRTSRRQRYFKPTDAKEDVYARETIELNKQDLIDATGGGTGFNDEHLITGINEVDEKIDALEPRVRQNEIDIANLKNNLGDYEYLVKRIDSIEITANSGYSLAKKNEARLNELELEQNSVEVDLSALHLKDAQQDAKIKQNEIDIAALQAAITGGEDITSALAQIEKNRKDIESLNSKMLIAEGRISDNKRDIQKNTSDISKLQQDVSKLNSAENLTPRVEDLENRVTFHDDQIKALTSNFAGIEYQVNTNKDLSEKNKNDIISLKASMDDAEYDIVDLQDQINSLDRYDDTAVWDSQKEQDNKIADNAKDISNNAVRIKTNEDDIDDLKNAKVYDSDVLLNKTGNAREFVTQAELNAHLNDNKADKEEINKVNDRIDLLSQDVKTNEDNIDNLGEILDALISGGIDGEVEIDLANYYKKSETYNSQEIDVRLEKKVNHGGDVLKGLYVFSGEEGEGGINIAGPNGEVTLAIREDGVVSQSAEQDNGSPRNFITRQNLENALDDLHEDLDVDNLLVNESIKIADTSSSDTPLNVVGKFIVEADGSVTQPEELENSLNRNLMNRKNVTDITKTKYDKSGGPISGAVTISSTDSQPLKIEGKEDSSVAIYNTGVIAQNPPSDNPNNNHMVNRKNLNDGLAGKSDKDHNHDDKADADHQHDNYAKLSGINTFKRPQKIHSESNESDYLLWLADEGDTKFIAKKSGEFTGPQLSDPSNSAFITRKFADDNYPKKSGDTFTGTVNISINANTAFVVKKGGQDTLRIWADGTIDQDLVNRNPEDKHLVNRKNLNDKFADAANKEHDHNQYLPQDGGEADNLKLRGTVYGDGINIAWKNNAYMLYASQGHDRYLGTSSDYRYDNLVVTYGRYNAAITDLDTRVRDKAAADHEHEPIDYPSVLIGQTPVKAGQLGYYNNVLLLKVR